MIENLKRIREPLAWALIVLVVASMGLTGWRLVTGLDEPDATIFTVFSDAALSWLNMSIAIPLVIVVMLCVLITPMTRRARVVAWVAAIVLSVGVVLTLVSNLLGMWASAYSVGVVLDVLGGLFDLAFKALAAGSLWVLIRGVRAGQIETPAPVVTGGVLDPEVTLEGGPAQPEQRSTTWSRTEASGTVWRTAAEAASGTPGRPRIDDDRQEGPPKG
jgi:hypothetical protein